MVNAIGSATQLPLGTMQWHHEASVVIVGSGAAGLMCLVGLLEAGVDTVLVTRGALTDSSTDWAQGGLAAVWSPQDTTQSHISDTLDAGAGLCDEAAVRDLAHNAPLALRRLIALGAIFDTDASGHIDLHLEGGHHARRILHAGGDQSGHEVERTLVERIGSCHDLGAHLTILTNTRAVDILLDERDRAVGLSALDAEGRPGQIRADAVVLASGGIGQLWPLTTNPPVASGDGLAMALRAGARVRDVEFMQFHPTILVVPPALRRPGDRGVLISEAVRGEGAFLVDHAGRRVMAGLHPLADLAPRDIVSAAEHAHMLASGESHLFLDATAFGASTWEHSFPSILAMCRERGVDPVREPIPVSPGAHYHCGGVVADISGRTDIAGLFALGELACTGIQGANRLASNSLTEGLVMGTRCATLLASRVRGAQVAGTARQEMDGADPVRRRELPLLAAPAFDAIREEMASRVGVLRDAQGLREALSGFDGLPGASGLDDATLSATNAAVVARAVTTAAATRTESRGCHRRSDRPGQDAGWARHLDWQLDSTGTVRPATDRISTPSAGRAAA
ncbi:L-aspartate oxidase [Propionibacterium cyclohexanicum]|uniref:L-aspartate oxidase n=1 Tax=Propionibacterium cyclohexanicum TaxID=64702 RepID=A0A1H9Q5J7_9ACTN|nr:L-aspartate oxidase [Propionibacterium cyclohexanicum]SER55836.1 L-aspartate oxidase [Propionibacterium cyclohexanicum]